MLRADHDRDVVVNKAERRAAAVKKCGKKRRAGEPRFADYNPTSFVYARCENGHTLGKGHDRCPACNTDVIYKIPRGKKKKAADSVVIFNIKSRIAIAQPRTTTGIEGLDRVLSGGIVDKGVYLLAGEPGSGKTSLAFKVAANMASGGEVVLYVSGEQESAELQQTAKRLGAVSDTLYLVCTKSVEEMLAAIEKLSPVRVIVDSINVARSEDATPGEVAQIKKSAAKLVEAAKGEEGGFSLVLVGHVTKNDMEIAGPRSLEHLVDAVLMYTLADNGRRFLRIEKNRHGPSGEFATFDMTSTGLQEVSITSASMDEKRGKPTMGYVIYPSVASVQPLLVEVIARVLLPGDIIGVPSERRYTGLGSDRMSAILGILKEDAEIDMSGRSVFVQVSSPLGGDIREPGIDFPVVAAIVSSAIRTRLVPGLTACGQFNYAGEAVHVDRIPERSNTARRAGYKVMLVPKGQEKLVVAGVEAVGVASIGQMRTVVELLAKRLAPASKEDLALAVVPAPPTK